MNETPARTGASTQRALNERICYSVVNRTMSDGYGSWIVKDREKTESLEGAVLVSSRTLARTHVPAIDVDLPVELVKTEHGHDLWVDVNMSGMAYRHLMRTLHSAGIGGAKKPRRKGHSKSVRQEEYWAARQNVVDDTSRQDTLKKLGPELATSFEGAVLVATKTSSPAKTREGRPMDNPWRIPLTREAMLVPSTENHHLYIDVELGWGTYERILSALVRARIVEKGYLKASRNRGATHLRLPWISKGELD